MTLPTAPGFKPIKRAHSYRLSPEAQQQLLLLMKKLGATTASEAIHFAISNAVRQPSAPPAPKLKTAITYGLQKLCGRLAELTAAEAATWPPHNQQLKTDALNNARTMIGQQIKQVEDKIVLQHTLQKADGLLVNNLTQVTEGVDTIHRWTVRLQASINIEKDPNKRAEWMRLKQQAVGLVQFFELLNIKPGGQ
jgi:hypothetical protein